jgi:hypothetical protein
VDLYGLEIKGQWPARVEYGMAGVGEEGAVLMQPDADGHGRVVTTVLPKTRSPAFAPRSGACSCRLPETETLGDYFSDAATLEAYVSTNYC